ncbi:MAG TPA: cysteine desulfurase NifS [Atribacteraceae bacterium]|nr:cysteine desulfurase NifS [Atribacteraceae bacterium]
MIYLDNNATTACDPRVVEIMLPFFKENYGNPSSLHAAGQQARTAVEEARRQVALLVGSRPEEILFTSGGTESNNLALKGIAQALRGKGNHILTSSIEHFAVLNVCRALEKEGYAVTYLPVDEDGLVNPAVFEEALRKDTILTSIMLANNETGVIEPVAELAAIAHEHGVLFHTDAVQAIGKIPIDVVRMNIDLLTGSAHKFHGPKGCGFLYKKKRVKLQPLLQGGHHEKGFRAGTENVPAIVGCGLAAQLASLEMEANHEQVGKLRDRLETGLRKSIPAIHIASSSASRLPNTSLVLVKYVEGEAMLLNLDFDGICVSSGSACTSGSLEPSHVLLACGYPHQDAHGSIRFSLSKFNREDEIDQVLDRFPKIVNTLRDMSPFKLAT